MQENPDPAPPPFCERTGGDDAESPESPGSPTYQRLIETAQHTPLDEAPPLFFYDPDPSDESEAGKGGGAEFYDCHVDRTPVSFFYFENRNSEPICYGIEYKVDYIEILLAVTAVINYLFKMDAAKIF